MFAFVSACTSTGPSVEGAPSHHRANGFANPSGLGGVSSLEFLIDRTRLALFPREASPVAALSAEEANTRWTRAGGQNAVQWLGHASLRLRLAGQIVLIDPVVSDVLGPAPPFGPSRESPPPVDLAHLQNPDAILVTHNHYDHYEPDTIRAVSGNRTTCLMPLKVSKGHDTGCAPTELDWHETHRLGPLRATLLPAQHDSARGLFDRDKALWGGWLLEGGGERFYISGDTGYGPHFAEARRHGTIDLAVLNVGGYEPRRINKNVHMDPEEAVQAVLDLGAKRALIVHWGTYGLGRETGSETYDRVRAAAQKAGLGRNRVVFLQIGDVLRF